MSNLVYNVISFIIMSVILLVIFGLWASDEGVFPFADRMFEYYNGWLMHISGAILLGLPFALLVSKSYRNLFGLGVLLAYVPYALLLILFYILKSI